MNDAGRRRPGSREPGDRSERPLLRLRGCGRPPKEQPSMRSLCIAALAALTPLAAQAQSVLPSLKAGLEPILVTASRALQPETTLRDAVVITRSELDESEGLTLGE